MSGHSKWSTIKHKKGAADQKRAKIFTKLIKEITVSAQLGGLDADANPRLRSAIQNAKGMNMPKDTIDRAISKADRDASSWAETTFEGYLPHGIAIFVECLTDNANRTFGEVRHCFTKTGGKLGVHGAVSYLYTYCSHISFSGMSEDDALETLMMAECEVTDIESDEDIVIITGEPGDLDHIKDALTSTGKELVFYEDHVTYVPNDKITLSEEDLAKFDRFISLTDDVDDIQEVYHNVELPESH